MNIILQISKELNLSSISIEKVLELFTAGGTVPFVARYGRQV